MSKGLRAPEVHLGSRESPLPSLCDKEGPGCAVISCRCKGGSAGGHGDSVADTASPRAKAVVVSALRGCLRALPGSRAPSACGAARAGRVDEHPAGAVSTVLWARMALHRHRRRRRRMGITEELELGPIAKWRRCVRCLLPLDAAIRSRAPPAFQVWHLSIQTRPTLSFGHRAFGAGPGGERRGA